MTDQEWQDLGRRAVACKHWRWLPGMLDSDGTRVLAIHATGDAVVMLGYIHTVKPTLLSPADLRDPATLGCLLALVREAHRDPCWQSLCFGDDTWAIEGSDYPTEAAALVAALEAAP